MAKYRKKPVVVEAVQWDGDNRDEIAEFLPPGYWRQIASKYLLICTRDGDSEIGLWCWVIKDIDGEFCTCKPDIFKATYEKVED